MEVKHLVENITMCSMVNETHGVSGDKGEIRSKVYCLEIGGYLVFNEKRRRRGRGSLGWKISSLSPEVQKTALSCMEEGGMRNQDGQHTRLCSLGRRGVLGWLRGSTKETSGDGYIETSLKGTCEMHGCFD